jgi:hypothetical protein
MGYHLQEVQEIEARGYRRSGRQQQQVLPQHQLRRYVSMLAAINQFSLFRNNCVPQIGAI